MSGKLKCCQLHEVSPIAHDTNGLCVNDGAKAKSKKCLKRLAKQFAVAEYVDAL